MKLLVAVVSTIVIIYFVFFNSNIFKQSFSFGDDYYAYNRSQGGGIFENYFYTIGGEDAPGMRQVVQIIKFPDEVLPEQYEYYMQPLFTRYKLKPYDGEALTRTGQFERAGLKFRSYSSTVEIDDHTHMAIYLTSLDERRGKSRILRDLESIAFE